MAQVCRQAADAGGGVKPVLLPVVSKDNASGASHFGFRGIRILRFWVGIPGFRCRGLGFKGLRTREQAQQDFEGFGQAGLTLG